LRIGVSALVAVALLCGCRSSSSPDGVPAKLADGWGIATPESVGLDAKKVEELHSSMRQGGFGGIRSFLLAKDGRLVHEAYFQRYDRDDLHFLYSVTKSVSSLLTGIALDKGLLGSVDAMLLQLLPPHLASSADKTQDRVALKHILSQSTGLDWNEGYAYSDKRNTHNQMGRSDNWMEFILSRRVVHTPGTRWTYNTGNTHLLAAVLKDQTGLDVRAFAKKHLLDPLGIREAEWTTDPQGYPCTGGSNGGLKLRARDLAKLGQMVLDDGKWNGRQVISKKWIDESTAIRFDATNLQRYGYQWWREKYRTKSQMLHAIVAYGHGGQILAIFRQLNLVIAVTSWDLSPETYNPPPLFKIVSALAH
jgi:CubicO group peptidase (beta-lactamase class C family)